jgi:hypothetical protein
MPAHHARLIQFPFWEHAASPARTWAGPFASRLGATQLTGGLALVGMYDTNICLVYETLFGSLGAGPGTRFSRFSGVGVIIPLPRVLQVSGCIQSVYIYCADTTEWNRVHPGLFCVVSDPPCWGSQNSKNRDCA